MQYISDDDLLYAVNPALDIRHGNGAFGLTMDVVRDERGDLSPEGVARERYGWWGNPDTIRRGVIDMDEWRELAAELPKPVKAQIVVDVAPDLTYTSIALGYAHGSKTAVVVDRIDGTGRALAKVLGLSQDLGEVVEIALTPTASFLSPKLTKAGIPHAGPSDKSPGKHRVLTNAEVGKGCVAFQEMVINATIAHVSQPELNDAARNGVTRYVMDTQQWDRRERRIDISPLVAASVAAQRWLLNTAVVKRPALPPRKVEASVTSIANIAF
jgi:hypothetical protein